MTDSPIRLRLRELLTAALRARDRGTATALRTALAALENAEAVATPDSTTAVADSEHVAGAQAGLGAAETARAELSDDDERRLVRVEAEELRAAAVGYEAAGQSERSADLRRAADVLDGVLDGVPGS